jgi:hypothetical protein
MAKKPEKHSDIKYPEIPSWQRSAGTYIAGCAETDEVTLIASEMEKKWGVDRLRLLVDKDLRVKFDRQRYKFNRAIWYGELSDVITESKRMVAAWKALDRAALAAGSLEAAPEVWEVALENGRLVAILRDWRDAAIFERQRQDRSTMVYTLEEVARLIHAFPEVVRAKEMFRGGEVTRTKGPERDPLHAMDSYSPIDDEIPF